MKKPLFIIIVLIAVSILITIYLTKFRQAISKPPSTLTPIKVRLKWLHQSQFAGHYIADKKGYYKDAGLSVTLLPFDYAHFPIDEVVNGQADFGVTGADELLIARENGKHIKALAVIYQENPVVAYALKSSGITKPVDFIGKKIGMEAGVNVETVIHAMLSAQGIDYKKDVTEIPIGYDAESLLTGKVDIATGYVTNEPIQAEEAGKPVNIIMPYDYGVKMYADILFTSEDTITKNPELVRSFVKTTLKGWEYAIKNIDESANTTLLYKDPNNKALNYKHQKTLLERSIPFIRPTSGSKVGEMNFTNWKKTYQLLKEYGVLQAEHDVSEVFTTEFIR